MAKPLAWRTALSRYRSFGCGGPIRLLHPERGAAGDTAASRRGRQSPTPSPPFGCWACAVRRRRRSTHPRPRKHSRGRRFHWRSASLKQLFSRRGQRGACTALMAGRTEPQLRARAGRLIHHSTW
jgi:hypothetical protein